MTYAVVQSGTVVGVVPVLPDAYGNITGFKNADSATQIANGFYPLVGIPPVVNPAYQTLSPSAYSIGATEVTVSWTVEALPLATVQTNTINELGNYADSALESPVTITALSLTTSFAPKWSGLITGAKDACTANPALVVQWQAADNTFHSLTAAQVVTLWSDASSYIQACFSNQAAHTGVIMGLTDPSLVAAHDCSTGWPATTI